MKLVQQIKTSLGLTDERRFNKMVRQELIAQTQAIQIIQAKQVASQLLQKSDPKIVAHIKEQFSLSSFGMPTFGPDPDESMFRSVSVSQGAQRLTGLQPDRKLSPVHQDYLNRVGVWLYYTNPIIKRAIDLKTALIVGDGFTVNAKNEKVQKILNDHWNRNHWNSLQYDIVREQLLFGELCLPVYVAEYTGQVTLGYIDPYSIANVISDPLRPQIPIMIELKNIPGSHRDEKESLLPIIRHDENGNYNSDGKVFYFAYNKLLSASRGFSPMLCLVDWADAVDRLIFARGEIRGHVGEFAWDVTLTNKTKEAIETYAKTEENNPRGTGTRRYHDENVKWEAVAPNLQAADASEDAKLLTGMLLAGIGLPSHWIFMQAEDVNRAGGLTLADPVYKELKAVQNTAISTMQEDFNYQLAMTRDHSAEALAGVTDEEMKDYEISGAPIAVADEEKIANTLLNVSNSLLTGEQQHWIEKDEAQQVFQSQLADLGHSIGKEN